ncbi:uncharacterized protein EI90DRAFT_3062605 [Cantharellus anzutake]|uniref:uncharacterized protein n=1 Tax=Cantharellus anzutake TaxID=1750568 RepID=UPI001905C12D|nr:uncharacterized protein EI90DRAFT_3062605 [Cantharellus anzutake]KAF8329433.1 hypothetical protein EI90DRAFT_3062605 [Cantharellus anzutake]
MMRSLWMRFLGHWSVLRNLSIQAHLSMARFIICISSRLPSPRGVHLPLPLVHNLQLPRPCQVLASNWNSLTPYRRPMSRLDTSSRPSRNPLFRKRASRPNCRSKSRILPPSKWQPLSKASPGPPLNPTMRRSLSSWRQGFPQPPQLSESQLVRPLMRNSSHRVLILFAPERARSRKAGTLHWYPR